MSTEYNPLRRLRKCEKFYIRVSVETLQRLEQEIRRAHDGMLPFVSINCEDGKSRKMLDVGWTYINALDEVSQGVSKIKKYENFQPDFVIWSRIEQKPRGISHKIATRAVVVRLHGQYRTQALELKMRESGIVL